MSRPRLRVALIGAGMVSAHHLAAWAGVEGAEVVAIADPDRARAAARAAAFGISDVHTDAAEMLASVRPDAVDIATPVATHAALCRLAAEAGVAILCQKPLAPTVTEAEALVAELAPRGRLMVHENWRFRPSYRQVAAYLGAGAIGRPRIATLEVASSGLVADASGRRPALERQPFLAGLERLIVFEVLVHHLDLLAWLFGPLRLSAAATARVCEAVRGEDSAALLLRSGALPITLSATLADPTAPAHIRDRLRIVGDSGTIALRDGSLQLHSTNATAGLTWAHADLYAASYAGAIAEFASALTEDRPFESPPEEHLAALRLVEAIYRAAEARPAPA